MPQLRLILMRHAKAAKDEPGAPDHGRRLSDRGRRASDALGRWLETNGLCPDVALVSTAARTRETWAMAAAHLPSPPEPVLLDALYHAEPEAILKAIRRNARGGLVALVGHNPGIGALAAALVAAAPDHARFLRYPTGATLVAEIPAATWRDIRPGTATAVAFVTPRDLGVAR